MMDAQLPTQLVTARYLQLNLQAQLAPYGGELTAALDAGMPHANLAQLYPWAYADIAAELTRLLADPARGWGAQSVLHSNGHRRPEELYQSPIFSELEQQENAWHEQGYDEQLTALLPVYVRWQPTQNEDALKDELEGLLWDVFDALNFLQWVAHMHAATRPKYLTKVARACIELGVVMPVDLCRACALERVA